jgi:ATP-dependent helicase HrpB
VSGDELPIDAVLPDILAAFGPGRRLVLAAPPGAGKTTRVPLALAGLYGAGVIDGRILLLEPRRIAARLAAERMASAIGERVGGRIGLSTRIERKVSSATRIEVITDGLFTRRVLSDPEMTGIGAVIFDEFHERRLNADLGLALALDVQKALHERLAILVMSATLDTARVAAAIDAPVVESAGRAFPVETIYLGRSDAPVDERMAQAVARALHETHGSVLAFLPGARDIQRVAERLQRLPDTVLIAPFYGALSPAEQDAAVSPAPPGKRKIVLATDIAESALTIEGVRVVIDSGLARVAEDDSGGFGQTLTTVRASRASVDQRRGRAGRTEPGLCYRLWDEAATRGLTASAAPEILSSDLGGLMLALAEWGERDPAKLVWLDAPPAGRVKAAQTLLVQIGATTDEGVLTARGREMARLPLPPRLSALIAASPSPEERALAAEIAALLGERGLGGTATDLAERLQRFRADASPRAKALRAQARGWGGAATPGGDAGRLLARAWPGQVARKRPGTDGSYLLASGRAGALMQGDALAKADWLVVVELGGAVRAARIGLALAISEADALGAGLVMTEERATFDPKTGKFAARRVKALGAIVLSETALPRPAPDVAAAAMLAAVQAEGFAAIGAETVVDETLGRLAMLECAGQTSAQGYSVDGWIGDGENWLLPVLRRKGAAVPGAGELRAALIGSFSWDVQEKLRLGAPLQIALPSGQSADVDYIDPRAPLVSARAQAFFGVSIHPALAGGRVPVTVELLSPGHKPAATTRDLPRFWREGYRDMAKDMRARYPKHDWPDDPAAARAHEGRTKKRLS